MSIESNVATTNAAVPNSAGVVTNVLDADAAGIELGKNEMPVLHYLDQITVKDKDGNDKKVIQEATFIAIDENGRVTPSFQVTLWPSMDALTQRGMRSVPGTGFMVKFVGGKYDTPYKEVAEKLRMLSDFMKRYRPNPADPTGYWKKVGVIKMVEKKEMVPMIMPKGLPEDTQVQRGAVSAKDQTRKI